MPSKSLRTTSKAGAVRPATSAQAKPSLRKSRVTAVSPTKSKTPPVVDSAPTRRVWFVGDDSTQRNSAAQALANELQLTLTRVDLGQVVSRYIGETEKNLNQLFARAADQRWLLFFDEADALFGKRADVKDSHDRFANTAVAYLLERIEQSNLPMIIATNAEPSLSPALLKKVANLVVLPRNRAPKIKPSRKKASSARSR